MSKGKVIFGAVVACLLWSTAFAGIKTGLQYNSTLQFAGSRFFISGLLILPFAGPAGLYWRTVWKHFGLLNLLAFSQTFLNYALFYTGVDLVPGAIGAIIIGAQPLIVALLAHWMMGNDRMNRRKWISISIGIAGVILVSVGRQELKMAGGMELLGILCLLAVNFTSGFSNILVSRNHATIAPFMLSSYSLIAGGLALFLVSLPLEGGFHTGPFPAEYWISLGWLSFMSAAAFSIWYRLLQTPGTKVSDLNLWKFLIPVFGALLSWLVIEEESPDWLTTIGMIVISVSLVGFYIRLKKPGKS